MEQVTKSPSLPPYPQMILEAVDSLNKKDGSNKSSISNYIESTYGELPEGHAALLSENLTSMKDSGELLLVKNNYLRPDPNSPVQKRGRGRPPKVRDPADVAAATESKGPSRGRGRPKKDPNAAPAPKKAKAEAEPGGSVSEPTPTKTGRPRGRPRKEQPTQLAQNGVEAN